MIFINNLLSRNFAAVRKGKEDIRYRTEADIQSLETSSYSEPNQGILDHERRRQVEVYLVVQIGLKVHISINFLLHERGLKLLFVAK